MSLGFTQVFNAVAPLVMTYMQGQQKINDAKADLADMDKVNNEISGGKENENAVALASGKFGDKKANFLKVATDKTGAPKSGLGGFSLYDPQVNGVMS